MKITLTKSILTACLLTMATGGNALAAGSKTVYNFTIGRTLNQANPTECPTNANVLGTKLNCQADGSFSAAMKSRNVKFYSVNPTSGRYTYGSSLTPYGHYVNANGLAVNAANRKRAIACAFDDTKGFSITTVEGMVEDGNLYTWKQALVNETTADTVEFHFALTIGDKETVETDMPAFNHRPDRIDSWIANPMVSVNGENAERNNCVQANVGDDITLGFLPLNEGESLRFNVKGPSGKSLRVYGDENFTLSDVTEESSGAYTSILIVTDANGNRRSQTCQFYVDVQAHQGERYDWKANTPFWSYDFRDEYPNGFPQPKKVHSFKQKNGKAANVVEGEWWSVFWGDDLNSAVGANDYNAMTNMMKKYDVDFAYIRDEMGWPPDINARKGWKSFVYVFGSGLSNDNESQTTEGGYQSSTYIDGATWPCVWASYYPVSRFRDDADRKWNDGDYQREAMIHEGIHALFADMEGVKQSAWFHEGGNVWLQMAMNAKRDNVYGSPGWLGVGNLICPFMPIECYSGWLQDGSFGGPSAEGVNMYEGGRQVCTWRNLIGGVQYGEVFPLFLGECVGEGAVPWIWRYCRTRVLEGIAKGNSAERVEGIGDEAMRSLILQYRARLATMDFGGFSNGCRNLLNNYFGSTVKAEWEPKWIDVAPFKLTPYQTLEQNDAEGWMAPDTITNPGWSGGNIIPVHVGDSGCEIFFRPEDEQMRAQLCYRTAKGETVYSQPVTCGKMKLTWDDNDAPANGVVFVVVANTDYIYTGEEQRKKHWDYRIKLGEGAYQVASKDVKWYFYEQQLEDETFTTPTAIDLAKSDTGKGGEPVIKILSGVLHAGQQVMLDLGGISPETVTAHLVGVSGIMIDEQKVSPSSTVQLPATLQRGMYILALHHDSRIDTFKVYVE